MNRYGARSCPGQRPQLSTCSYSIPRSTPIPEVRLRNLLRGAVAKFAAGGSPTKKDLGLIAMSYGNIYVASVAMVLKTNTHSNRFSKLRLQRPVSSSPIRTVSPRHQHDDGDVESESCRRLRTVAALPL